MPVDPKDYDGPDPVRNAIEFAIAPLEARIASLEHFLAKLR